MKKENSKISFQINKGVLNTFVLSKLGSIVLIAFFIFPAVTSTVYALPKGPFYLPALCVGETIRRVPAFVAADEHKTNKVRMNTTFRWVNLWAHHVNSEETFNWQNSDPDTFPFEYGSYLVDVEIYTLNHRISYQVLDNLSIEIGVPVHHYGGGSMDGLIEGFHDMFSLGQHNRTDWGRDETHLFFVDQNNNMLYNGDHFSGTYVGDCEIGGVLNLLQDTHDISMRFLLKLPTSQESSLFDQNSFDMTLQGLYTWHNGRWSGYHGISLTRFGSGGNGTIDYYRTRWATMNTLEYRFSNEMSFIFQTVAVTATADYPEFDLPDVETTMGFKHKFYYGVLEFGLIENLLFFDNSPDFGVHVGYSVGFL